MNKYISIITTAWICSRNLSSINCFLKIKSIFYRNNKKLKMSIKIFLGSFVKSRKNLRRVLKSFKIRQQKARKRNCCLIYKIKSMRMTSYQRIQKNLERKLKLYKMKLKIINNQFWKNLFRINNNLFKSKSLLMKNVRQKKYKLPLICWHKIITKDNLNCSRNNYKRI